MPTNYPGSADSFNVPGSPSTTPLSSAGTGTRNHIQHHQDLGDAIVALQGNATQTSHTHDGTGLNGNPIDQVNSHDNPDTDSSTTALHHTIGVNPTQAAAGNHQHFNYVDLTSAQPITGKKTFSVGANAPVIPDLSYAQHSHAAASEGGGAVPLTTFTGQQASFVLPGLTSRVFNITNTVGAAPIDFSSMSGSYYIAGNVIIQWQSVSPALPDYYSIWVAVGMGPVSTTYSLTENICIGGFANQDNIPDSLNNFMALGSYVNAGGRVQSRGVMTVPFSTQQQPGNPMKGFIKLRIKNDANTAVTFSFNTEMSLLPIAYRAVNTWQQ